MAGKTVLSLINTCQPQRFRDEYCTHYKVQYKYPDYFTVTLMIKLTANPGTQGKCVCTCYNYTAGVSVAESKSHYCQ